MADRSRHLVRRHPSCYLPEDEEAVALCHLEALRSLGHTEPLGRQGKDPVPADLAGRQLSLLGFDSATRNRGPGGEVVERNQDYPGGGDPSIHGALVRQHQLPRVLRRL